MLCAVCDEGSLWRCCLPGAAVISELPARPGSLTGALARLSCCQVCGDTSPQKPASGQKSAPRCRALGAEVPYSSTAAIAHGPGSFTKQLLALDVCWWLPCFETAPVPRAGRCGCRLPASLNAGAERADELFFTWALKFCLPRNSLS